MKKCSKCKIEKELSFFDKNKNCKDGHKIWCKSCMKEYRKEYRKRNKKKLAKQDKLYAQNNREKTNGYKRKYGLKNKEKHRAHSRSILEKIMVYHASRRAKCKGLEFNITDFDIIIPKICPVLGIELSRDNRKQQNNSPTIDRIDNNKGYTKDNIQVISWRANDLKANSTIDEYKKLYQYYVLKERNNNILNSINDKKYIRSSFNRIERHAKRRGIEFLLTHEQLKELYFNCPKYCPVLGIEITNKNKEQLDSSISIDRIDNSKGYYIDNIEIISWRANDIKSNAMVEEIEKIYHNMVYLLRSGVPFENKNCANVSGSEAV